MAILPMMGAFLFPGTTLAVGSELPAQIRNDAEIVEDSYIVVLKRPTSDSQDLRSMVDSLASRYGGELGRTYSHALRGFSVRLSEGNAKSLATDPEVAYVQENRRISVAGEPETDVVQLDPPWGLDRIDQRTASINGRYNYITGYSGSGVRAYVIDTGIRVSHSEFGGRATAPRDFIDNDFNGNDCHGHGTHVAGTIAGTTYGVAKGASVVGVRVLNCAGEGTLETVLAGIDWVTENAIRPAVVNMSLGGSANQALDDAVRGGITAGLPFVVAAGNSGTNANNFSPARLPEAITVAASDADNHRASFSNYGAAIDINAPGVAVKSAWIASNADTRTLNGTSMAAPHVTGVVARLLTTHPTASPAAIVNALAHNSHKYAISEPDVPYDPQPPIPTSTDPVVQTTGHFLHASWQAQPLSGCILSGVNGNNHSIPDGGSGTMSPVSVTGCSGVGYVQPLRVTYSVIHSRPDDVRIDLVAPDGTRYRLRDEGTPAPVPDFSTNAITGALSVNVNETARNGTWRLDVQDRFPDNFGYLDTWSISF
ncbi:S8 family serine peptidase [Catellatospora sp. NPDC049609]|uniref:S8 family peptidase n=1 Tax=Catellatospora sp. NPDC049609 TaxID=3155505 RepID=UPI00342759AF